MSIDEKRRTPPTSGRASIAQDDSDEIGGVLCSELVHDMNAVHLDSAWTDSKYPCRLLVGGGPDDMSEDIAFARR